MPENPSYVQEGTNTKLEKFVKTQNVDVDNNLIESMDEEETLQFSRKIVNAFKRPGSMEAKAIKDAISIIEEKYHLSHGLVQAWAESYVSHQDENGTMSEASYYAKPKAERGRDMLRILEEAKRASTPDEFKDYCKIMGPIIVEYKDIMPLEYVSTAQNNLKKEGFSEQDFAAIDSQNPTQILKLVLGDHREEMAKHIAGWFSVEWPKYTTEKDVNNSIADCARFITDKYALEWNMQMSIKDTLSKDFKEPFKNAVEKAKKDSSGDSTKAANSIQSSLVKDFEDYYQKHYVS